MSTVYITGHRNPDFDSVASAFVCAHLKNKIDPDNQYLAVRCGNLNPQTRAIFDKLGIEAPGYLKNVKTVVADVVNRDIPRLETKDPLQTAIGVLDETGLSLLPIFDESGNFKGTISSIEVSHFLMRENSGARPFYHFFIDNLGKVVPGRMLIRGEMDEFAAPVMIGAMPFERSLERISTLESNRPLLIVGLRRNLVNHAISNNFPALILTGVSPEEAEELDFSGYKGTVYLSDVDTAETIRLLRFSTPVEDIMETRVENLDVNDDFNQAKTTLANSGLRGLPVFEEDYFAGIVSRASFLDRPKKKIILVDHNELEQSITGASDAEILEIIDHHRVGAIMSQEAFCLYTKPVGCTCTILRQLYRQHGVAIPTEIAKLMLSAILSDTVLLKSPTTTDEDRQTVEGLSRHAGVNWHDWGQELFAIGARLTDIDPMEAVNGDFKTYNSGNVRFGIGQVEVQTFADLEEIKPRLDSELVKTREQLSLDGTMLLITNVMSEDSILLLQGLPDLATELPYESSEKNVLSLPDILSRKKQLLPGILQVLEKLRVSDKPVSR